MRSVLTTTNWCMRLFHLISLSMIVRFLAFAVVVIGNIDLSKK